ncbi:MAG TPA: hypothetical protein VFI92_16090 [Steroidobacteraceae bacterium]|nr:hypothetical protein [Steroidobacteraceae bacterium]
MRRSIVTLLALVASLGIASAADSGQSRETVDLRDAASLERLREENPSHYATIQQILAGLSERPDRLETDWLQATFDARDVELSRLLFKTSHPPRQMLRFTLDDTRYALHVVRSDLAAKPELLR